MRKLAILYVSVFFVFTACKTALITHTLSLKEAGDLEKAVKTINEAVDTSNEKAESTINWPRTWEARGEIYQAIYQSKDKEIKKLSDTPLDEAYQSYLKAIELDREDKYSKSIKIKLTLLINDLSSQAVDAFKSEEYKKALQSFEKILVIDSLKIMRADSPEAVDTVFIYNAGLAAYKAGQYDKAINYYKEAARYGYNGASTYGYISNFYQMKKDTIRALNALKEGFEKYPEDNSILTSMVQIYLDMDKTEDAMKYLEMAIEQDPGNASYYFALGRLYEEQSMEGKAIETYKKCIDVDSTYFNGYYNLGALYYNNGVEQIEVANSVPAGNNVEYMKEIKKADKWWEKALPYMEKCRQINPDDKMTLESLKNLYYRTKQMNKYYEILTKLGQN